MSQAMCDAIINNETGEALSFLTDPTTQKNINKLFIPRKYKSQHPPVLYYVKNQTCLYWACSQQNKDIVKEILSLSIVNVNKEDNEVTALHVASQAGSAEIVKLLCEKGAKIAADVSGITPIHRASIGGHKRALEILLRHDKSTINDKDNADQRTALHLASMWGHIKCVQVLVSDYQADITVLDCDDMTPLELARKHNKGEVVKFLTENQQKNTEVKQLEQTMLRLQLKQQERDQVEELYLQSHVRHKTEVHAMKEEIEKLKQTIGTMKHNSQQSEVVVGAEGNSDTIKATEDGFFAANVDQKMTRIDHKIILQLMELVCLIEYPTKTGMASGTGIYFGLVTDKMGTLNGCILTSYHHYIDGLSITGCGNITFGYYKHYSKTRNQKTYKLSDVIASNKHLDYILITVQGRDVIDRFKSMKIQGASDLEILPKTLDLKSVCAQLRLIGHPGGDKMQDDTALVENKEDITRDPQVWEVLTKVNRGQNIGCNVKYLNDSVYAYYQCNSFHGSSGAPCFKVLNGRVQLVCLHKGGIYYHKTNPQAGDRSDLECGVFMECIMEDIKAQLHNPNSPWKLQKC